MAIKRFQKIFSGTLCSATESTCLSSTLEVSDCTDKFAIQMAASTSAAAITMTYEVSHDGTNFDATTTSPSRTIITGLTDATIVKGFDTPVCKYLRIRGTGTGSNPAGTTVTGYLMATESE